MYSYSYKKRVCYAETDKMGYLYYGHYAKYYEIGRVEAMRSLGFPYKKMEDELGVMLPVVHMECRYIAPAFYDDEIEIQTILKEKPTKLITFHNTLVNSENKVINQAVVKLFFIDMQSGQRISIPSQLAQLLNPYFKN